jgi:hypothetical protein
MTKCELDRVVRRYAYLFNRTLLALAEPHLALNTDQRRELNLLGVRLQHARGDDWRYALNERIWRNEL